jgi:hypothetical protein
VGKLRFAALTYPIRTSKVASLISLCLGAGSSCDEAPAPNLRPCSFLLTSPTYTPKFSFSRLRIRGRLPLRGGPAPNCSSRLTPATRTLKFSWLSDNAGWGSVTARAGP